VDTDSERNGVWIRGPAACSRWQCTRARVIGRRGVPARTARRWSIPAGTSGWRHLSGLFLLGLLLFVGLSPLSVRAQEGPGPAERRAREVLALVNLGNPDSTRAFIQENFAAPFRDAFPMEQHIGFFARIHEDMGAMVAEGVLSSSPSSVELVARSEDGSGRLRIAVQVEPEEPFRIALVNFAPAGPPGERSDLGAEAPEIGDSPPPSSFQELEGVLGDMCEAGEFSGVVLVSRKGATLLQGACGFEDKAHAIPIEMDTRFNLASLNKLFTSTAVAQLAESGALNLDDPLGRHLEGLPAQAAEEVTIRHLLQMRSGWGDYWTDEDYIGRWRNLRTVSDYMEFLGDEPLRFTPGTRTLHSNTGFIVLGAVIESVSGQDYFSYVQDHIFRPAGMATADPQAARDAPGTEMAVGYTNQNPFDTVGEGFRWTNLFFDVPAGTPAGGGIASARDLLAFADALAGGLLLGPEHTSLLLSGFSPDHRSVGIQAAGAILGANTFFATDLETGYTTIVLSNYDPPVAMDVARAIRELLEAEE